VQIGIELSGVSKTYPRRHSAPVQAVKELNLAIPAGKLSALLGPNGAGKTTTIKMICGLIRPSTGQIRIGEHDVWRHRSVAVRQIGVVLEGTRNVHWSLSARDNLIYSGHLKGMCGRRLARRTDELLHQLDLWDRHKDLVRTFSRGMQQKVAIACALVADPPFILLDEPTLGLDVQTARAVKEQVGQLAREHGKTILLTTHRLDVAQELCERVTIMSQGRILTDQPMAELLSLFARQHYEITIRGSLTPGALDGFADVTIRTQDENRVLDAPIPDADALYALIDRLRESDCQLLAVHKSEPNLEEVFLQLMDADLAEERENL